ncbi:MetQ/NlpA family ABC transporter substrate-binding protein [Actinotignum sp. GS-2025c]|uniref:MetQ/NlpA family ABC transporter substrate-binding protein n=1 Tax=Actinotignum sp. GS-2025c TaxID=3427276 RepID=UPI003F448B42
MKKLSKIALVAAVSALALSGCGSSDSSSSAPAKNDDGAVRLVVGASPAPHKQILEFVNDNLAKDAGFTLDIREYNDYVQPNVALNAGEIDANYFQHLPYLENEIKEKNYTLDHGAGIHIEPYGIYSKKIKQLSELKDNAVVGVTNDPSNQARALDLLQKNNLIKLNPQVASPTIYDVVENPKNLTFREADAPSVPKILPDVDIAIINGNFALQNGLVPSKDAIYTEDPTDNPYGNILAWNSKTTGEKLEGVKKLDAALHSPEVAKYIRDTWPNGEVIPAF